MYTECCHSLVVQLGTLLAPHSFKQQQGCSRGQQDCQ